MNDSPASGDGPLPVGSGPLDGIRVLDLTAYLSGPFATHQLGDLGAQVVKVEPPGGEPTRAGVAMRPGDPTSPFMLGLHRDRLAIVVELKAPAGRALFMDLAARADVVMENFRPGITARLGITYDDVKAHNPRIVYCSITGYGPDGPAGDMAAIDGPVQARAGVFDYTAGDGGPGAPLPMTVGDLAGGTNAVAGVLAALLRRERTGVGSLVEVSLFESLLQWTAVADRRRSLAPPVTLVGEGSDGRAFVVQTPMHFQDRLVEVVGRAPGCAHVARDPRFATTAARREHAEQYQAAIVEAFRRRPRADWLADLHAAGVPAGPVQSIDEALADPQLLHRRGSVTVDAPGMGPTQVPLSPFVFDGVRRSHTTMPPALGEHTRQVLASWLGADDARVDELAVAGAFGSFEPY